MAIIQELGLFSWKDFQDDLQNIGDLERFKLVIETMPDQKLIQILRTIRTKGRNDFLSRPSVSADRFREIVGRVWFTVLGIYFSCFSYEHAPEHMEDEIFKKVGKLIFARFNHYNEKKQIKIS